MKVLMIGTTLTICRPIPPFANVRGGIFRYAERKSNNVNIGYQHGSPAPKKVMAKKKNHESSRRLGERL